MPRTITLVSMLVATAALAQKPTHTLNGLEFRDGGVAATCANGDELNTWSSDASGAPSDTSGTYLLLLPEKGAPLTQKPKPSRTGPNGETLELEVVQSKGKWVGDRYEWVANPREGYNGYVVPTAYARLYAVKGKARRLISTFIAVGLRGTMTPYWSPDGERVALGLEGFDGMKEKTDACFIWTPTRGVSIEYGYSDPPRDGLHDGDRHLKFIGRLRGAGYPVAELSTPKKARTASVLFVPPSLSADEVAKLKEATGLKLSVEPLTWKIKGEVLLVVGSDDLLK